MDKSWINEDPWTDVYQNGLDKFVQYASDNASSGGLIYCPCKKCCNSRRYNSEIVKQHLTINGWSKLYSRCKWAYHGEVEIPRSQNETLDQEDESQDVDDMCGMLHEAFGIPTTEGGLDERIDEPNPDASKFYNLMEDAEKELYPGCKKFSKLSFLIRLYHIKCLCGLSDKGFTMVLELLKEAFPEGETLPDSFYYTKKIIGELGLGYDKIDACPNDCMLYWKETKDKNECSVCKTSRWKTTEASADSTSTQQNKTPAKVLRHFPLKPRLQRLFMSSKTAGLMTWHANDRVKDGVLRHPADFEAWATLDDQCQNFAAEPRNVRLGLATDGFNPFGTMSNAHSTWPVVLMPYNLPPWLCMKQPYFIMSLLIPGPSAPGNNIDVYLRPLIDELKDLWVDGLCTYDATKKQNFTMRAALLWTINDFPAYANLSGWSTKGYFACPHCNVEVDKMYLDYSRKVCYMGHRRFLECDHIFRSQEETFNGKTEYRGPPVLLSGSQQLDQIGNLNVTFGEGGDKDLKRADGWKKRNVFFELPYWEHLLIRHNLDVMHTEKNICNIVIRHLLDIFKRDKEGLKAREDLVKLGIRPALQPFVGPKGNKIYNPACYNMSPQEKDIFCSVLGNVQTPDGYAANISRCVNVKKRTLSGLKSHDHHIIMQQLLLLAVRKSLPKNVAAILIEFSNIFRELCSKVGTVDGFMALESRISLTLCHLETIFPPAFFNVMVHLAIHLPYEARIAGPVQYRWMYPIERYLLTLKSYVRNRSRPEGSIAEGYLVEECLTFCTRYLQDVETKSTRVPRNYEDNGGGSSNGLPIFSRPGRKIGKC